MTSLRTIEVPVAPGASAPQGQRVVVLPRLRVALTIGRDRARFAKLRPKFNALCEVRYKVQQRVGESVVVTEHLHEIDPEATTDFVVRDASVTQVELEVEVLGRHAAQHAFDERPRMLHATQRFDVRDGRLAPAAVRSPLMELTADAAGVEALVQCDVLDYTAYWFGLAVLRTWNDARGQTQTRDLGTEFKANRGYEHEGDGVDMPLRVLLHVDDPPMLWTASVPEAARDDKRAAVSAYMFLLPYHEAWGGSPYPPGPPREGVPPWPSPAQRWVSPYRPSRYLLADRDDFVHVRVDDKGVVRHGWVLGVGMERALRKSGKAAVLLVSISNGNVHGLALTSALPTLVTRSLRLLASHGLVATARPEEKPVTLGRLAVGGFSDGASFLASALQANTRVKTVTEGGQARTVVESDVHEAYVHDPRRDWPGFQPSTWIAWLGVPGHKLRMTRMQGQPTQVLVDAARKAGLVEGRDWSVYVADPARLVESLDDNPHWRFMMKEYNFRGRNPTSQFTPMAHVYDVYGHQFMMHGARADAPQGESFTCEFLKNSDL